ncbi:MAG: polysaccharide biosynthesis tyrosine autokinase [Pontixanthobacter sp.]
MNGEPHAAIDFWRLWRRAVEHRLLVLGVLLAACVAAVAVTLLQTPLYMSTTQIEISRVDNGGTSSTEADGGIVGEARDQQYYNTQYQLLQSRSIAASVVEAEDLTQEPVFLEAFDIDGSEISPELAISLLQENATIEAVPESNLANISFSSPNAGLSSLIANTWADEFLRMNYEKRFGNVVLAREQLQDQLQEMRVRLEDSEARLNNYANSNGIIVTETTSDQGDATRSTLLAAELSALSSALGQATVERIATQSTANSGASPTVAAQPALAQAQAELASARTTFGPQHPNVEALEAQVEALRGSAAASTSDFRNSQRAQYRAALQKERELQQRYDDLTNRYLAQQSNGVQYGILEREVRTNREIYDGLLQRYKEIGTIGSGTNNMNVVEVARPAGSPYYPSLLINLLIALALAILLIAAILYLIDLFDQTIRDPEDVNREFGLPLLGIIPISEGVLRDDLGNSFSAISEAYTSTRSSLQFAFRDNPVKSLMLTSSHPGEGKTSSSLAVAKSFADLGERVILVDLDLRRRGLSKLVGGDSHSGGTTKFLTGTEDRLAADKLEEFGVDFLGARSSDVTPVTLLASSKLRALLDALESQYDRVIIDGPPVIGLADAPQISTHVGGIVFIIQANSGSNRAVRRALSRLRDADANMVGAVLSQVDSRNNMYGYSYEYMYNYVEKAD